MLLKRTKHGLDKVTASITDVDNSSLFDIFVPKQLRAGKNEIRLRLVNDGLVKGSDVLIDVLDQNKEPLYYEFSDVANEDKSRSIIVHVTETDLTGKAYFYVYSKLGQDSSYMALINLEINSELETEQEIKFSEPPEIFYSEKRLATQTFSNQTRQVIKANTVGTISTISPIIPMQLVKNTFNVEKAEIRELKSNNTVGSGSTTQLPQYFDLAQITSNGFPFSSSYKNGTIEINGIDLDVPIDAISSAPFLNQSYSASIINVISTGSIEIYPPFSKLIEYQTANGNASKVYDRFVNETNFTCSYFEVLALSQTNYTQSYAVFDIFNLDPAAGKIDSVDISYKNLSLIGDNYEPLGNFKVKSINYLIDSSSLFFDNEKGIIERPIGTFKNGVVDFQSYWQTSSLVSVSTTDSVTNGIKFSGNEVLFQPKSQFNPVNRKETEWKLSFDFNLQPSQSFEPQLDIFISSSTTIKTDVLSDSVYQPYSSSNIGAYIGSITDRTGKGSFNFNINEPSRITPIFALRRGFLSIGNVTLTPTEKVGYNASQTRIYAPLNLPTGSEVNFKIDYVNPVGKRLSKFTSLLPGVYFEGSFKPSTGGTVIPNGTVSGSDQLTGSYDNRYERKGTNIISSSQQIKNNLPSGTISSSNQLASIDLQGILEGVYVSQGIGVVSGSTQVKNLLPTGTVSASNQVSYSGLTGIPSGILSSSNGFISSSQQISSDISGSFTLVSASLSARIAPFEGKTLVSSSNQINYDSIQNKLNVSGSGLGRFLFSSGSASSSFSTQNMTYDNGRLNITSSLFLTGSSSTRMSYSWDGPKTLGTTPGIVWTNMENATNVWLGSGGSPTSDANYIGDFTEITQGRLYTFMSTLAGGVTSSLQVQYSADGLTGWNEMVTLTLGAGVGAKDSGWKAIPDASKGFFHIRLVGFGGDGARDPRFSPPIVLFR